MSVLLNVVFPVLLVAAVAFAAQPLLNLDPRTLSRATFYLFNPALVLSSLATSDVGGDDFTQVALAVIAITLLLWGFGSVAASALALDGRGTSAFFVATLIGNTGNYGLPVSLFAFGEAGLARATIFYVVSSLLQASLGVYLAARGRVDGRAALGAMLRVPVLYAAAGGLALNVLGLAIPAWLEKSLSLLAQATVPVMLTLLGVQLAVTLRQASESRPAPRLLLTATATRLVAAPCFAVAVAWILRLDELTRAIVLLQSAMPTAVIAITIASEFQANPEFATSVVFLSTILSLASVTLLLNLLL